MQVNINDLVYVYEKEISRNTKNKRKIYLFNLHKMQNICHILDDLESGDYVPLRYNIFAIFEPKCRIIMSLSIRDKIINHYMARYVLIPKLEKYLDIRNCATRYNMGMDYGNRLLKRYLCESKGKGDVYILKLDISKYFYSIDHNVLKSMLRDKLSIDEYGIISSIIDSTNSSYINEEIDRIKSNYTGCKGEELGAMPYYEWGKGLSLGAMVSQFLSIFYLSSLDHFIVHNLHIKRYIRYMDDMICISNDKDYLYKCRDIIEDKLISEYKLRLNKKKTRVYNAREGFIFLGHRYRVINDKIVVNLRGDSYYKIKRNIKKGKWLFVNNESLLSSLFCSYSNYRYGYRDINNHKIVNAIDKSLYSIRQSDVKGEEK